MKGFFALAFVALPHLGGLAAPLPGGDKASLAGTITDKQTGQPLAGVAIYFPDLRTGTSTRSDGTYAIQDLPSSKLLVKVTMVGYATVVRTIDMATETRMDLALEPSVTELAEAVVTGTSKATSLRRDPVPTVLVPRQTLRESTGANIIEALNKVPGVSTWTTGPNVSKPFIRGLGSNRVLTLFDGTRQEGQQWGEEHGVEVDQFLIDRIEVVKGPASLMYGSDALAGVVNLLPARPVDPGAINGELLSSYMTNNEQIAGSFALNGNTNGFIWGTRFSHKQASNYQNSVDHRVYNTKYKENDLNASFGVNRAWGYSHVNFSVYDNVQEIPDGSRDPLTRQFTRQISEEDTVRDIVSDEELNSYTIGVVHQHVQHYRFNVANSFMMGDGRISLNLGYQESRRREFSHPDHPDLAGLFLTLNTYSYDLKYFLPEIRAWEVTLGVNGMRQKNSADEGTEFVIPSYTDLDVGPFAHVKRSFNKLDLSAGVRYDVRAYENDAMFTRPDPATGFDMTTAEDPNDSNVVKQFDHYQHTFTGVSGSAGLAYNINDRFTLKANIARGYRAPNAAEISAKGVHPGTGFQQLGDADLKPEFSFQEDIGVFLNTAHVTGSLELFVNSISNYIYNEKLAGANGADSLFSQNGDEFPVFKFRQTTARLVGGEFTLDIHPHPLDWLHFENSIAFVQAENLGGNGAMITDSTRFLPLIPPLHTNSELRGTMDRTVGCFAGLFAKFGMQVYTAQDRFFGAYGTETSTPGYVLLDAGVGGDVVNRKGATILSFSVLGSNLADVAYQNHMSRLKYMEDDPDNASGHSGIYDMGRNISVKVVVPFGLKKPAEQE